MVSALMKLAGGSPSLAKELNVDAFLQQVPDSEHSTAQHLLMVSSWKPCPCCVGCHYRRCALLKNLNTAMQARSYDEVSASPLGFYLR